MTDCLKWSFMLWAYFEFLPMETFILWGHRTTLPGNSREFGRSLIVTLLISVMCRCAGDSLVSALDNTPHVCSPRQSHSCFVALLYYQTPSASQPKAASLLGIRNRHPPPTPPHTFCLKPRRKWLISFLHSNTQTHQAEWNVSVAAGKYKRKRRGGRWRKWDVQGPHVLFSFTWLGSLIRYLPRQSLEMDHGASLIQWKPPGVMSTNSVTLNSKCIFYILVCNISIYLYLFMQICNFPLGLFIEFY